MGTRVLLDVDAIGRRAFDRRELLHLEQEEVAAKAGMSRAYVSRLENGGVRNPKLADLAAIAEALGLSLDVLIFGTVEDTDVDAAFPAILKRRFGPEVGEALVQIDRIAALLEHGDSTALAVLMRNTASKYDRAHG